MWRELKICFFTSTDFKARNFLIYKYILCLTEVLEHKSFINFCWMSELINESLRTIWRKHYNSIKSWAELKGEDQGKLEDHLEGSPREDTNQTVCWLLEDLAAWSCSTQGKTEDKQWRQRRASPSGRHGPGAQVDKTLWNRAKEEREIRGCA